MLDLRKFFFRFVKKTGCFWQLCGWFQFFFNFSFVHSKNIPRKSFKIGLHVKSCYRYSNLLDQEVMWWKNLTEQSLFSKVVIYKRFCLKKNMYVPIHFLTRTGKIIYRRSRREVKVNFENWLTCPERESRDPNLRRIKKFMKSVTFSPQVSTCTVVVFLIYFP